ncbi:unnamed protein product [Protopolystoma xenopodis]|uniref:UBA domain-containing protein n=1 Tax=Protopolystoma xenopodis TaxID=117903 RepID=A0A448WC89_9PLAT|nr:unnamed protein product [Protopolystoma xenopodis]
MPSYPSGSLMFAANLMEKEEARDLAVAQLVSLGYPANLASASLKITKGDMRAALDRLVSRQANQAIQIKEESCYSSSPSNSSSMMDRRGRRERGRGGLTRRRNYDPDLEDDPRFDPVCTVQRNMPEVAASRAAGIVRSNSAERINLAEAFQAAKAHANIGQQCDTNATTHSSSSVTYRQSARIRLPLGCPIMAPDIGGVYREAKFGGLLPFSVDGERAVVLTYVADSHSMSQTNDLAVSDLEEVIAVDLLRGLNMEKVELGLRIYVLLLSLVL